MRVRTGGGRQQGSGGLDQERRDDLQAPDGLLVFSSFCHRIFGKSKEEERERFRRILKQVSNILKTIILSQNNLQRFANIKVLVLI
jgi:hypothetical protein